MALLIIKGINNCVTQCVNIEKRVNEQQSYILVSVADPTWIY